MKLPGFSEPFAQANQRHGCLRIANLVLFKLVFISVSVKNIIQVKDSIPWVRCASGNVSSFNHHHESSSLSFVPVNVCAVFGFVTIRTSSRPVLIGAQVVPICPSDCYQDHDHDDHDEHNDHDHDDNDQQS